MKRGLGFFLAVTTAAINWLVYYKIGAHFSIPDSAFLSAVLVLSLAFHELGHLIAFRLHGIKTYILLLIIGGATIPYKKDNEKCGLLDPSPQMTIALAGIFGNFFLIGLSVPFFLFHAIDHSQLISILLINGLLVFTNIFPIPLSPVALDGTLFMEAFLRGVKKKDIFPHTLLIIAVLLALVVLSAFAFESIGHGQKWVASVFLFLAILGVLMQSFRRFKMYAQYPDFYLEARLVEPRIQKRWVVLYLLLVLASFASIAFAAMSVSQLY